MKRPDSLCWKSSSAGSAPGSVITLMPPVAINLFGRHTGPSIVRLCCGPRFCRLVVSAAVARAARIASSRDTAAPSSPTRRFTVGPRPEGPPPEHVQRGRRHSRKLPIALWLAQAGRLSNRWGAPSPPLGPPKRALQISAARSMYWPIRPSPCGPHVRPSCPMVRARYRSASSRFGWPTVCRWQTR